MSRRAPKKVSAVPSRAALAAAVAAAVQARDNAHAPYSGYQVGAALVCSDGSMFAGCNVENRSYGLTVCAERHAVAAMVAAGKRQLAYAVVVTGDRDPASPCGACRQVLAEFHPKLPIYLVSTLGKKVKVTLDKLLPRQFEFVPKSR